MIYQSSLKVRISNSENHPREDSELVSASGTAAEHSAGRNAIYKSKETTVNAKVFLLPGEMTETQASTFLTKSIGNRK